MHPSARLCRAQEAFHQGRAANTSLANVRTISEKAAAAWRLEALAADQREERHERSRLVRIAELDAVGQSGVHHDRSFSENPDRGFADLAG